MGQEAREPGPDGVSETFSTAAEGPESPRLVQDRRTAEQEAIEEHGEDPEQPDPRREQNERRRMTNQKTGQRATRKSDGQCRASIDSLAEECCRGGPHQSHQHPAGQNQPDFRGKEVDVLPNPFREYIRHRRAGRKCSPAEEQTGGPLGSPHCTLLRWRLAFPCSGGFLEAAK